MALPLFREDNHARWIGVRPAHDGEQVYAQNDKANGSATVYTVPADKVLLLSDIGLMATVAGVGRCYLLTVPDGVNEYTFAMMSIITAVGVQHGVYRRYYPMLEIGAGVAIAVNSNAAGLTARGSIRGFLIDNY